MPSVALELNPRSPIPLYHQIAEALRYRIATGAIEIGATLPPLREAARLWKVNLHTVRSAYAALAAVGIVETRAPVGTQVLPGAGVLANRARVRPRDVRSREAFAQRVIEEARAQYRLSLPALLELLGRGHGTAGQTAPATVHVAECSMSQSADLARQIGERWRVRAVPWPIHRAEPPGDHAIVATYFHYNDLRLRWPDRFPGIRFLAISPDPGLVRRLLPGVPAKKSDRGARVTAVLCEREEPMLRNIAADLSRILPEGRIRLVTRLIRKPASILDHAASHQPVLVSPRVWGELPEFVRKDPRVHEVRYVFQSTDLEALGREFDWPAKQEA
jgi:DNA-binding transcriptional regulator YhcF (GntR family)